MSRRRRGLTPEEKALWHRVADTATPLSARIRQKGGVASDDDRDDTAGKDPEPRVKPQTVFSPMPRFRIGQAAGAAGPDHSRAPSPAERLAAAPLRMDHKVHKRMSRGKIRPEARLDLHGMTLAAAHPHLIHFILSAHAQGHRLVLVITGKGRGDHGPLPTRPGALRHQVPHWLHTAPLSAVVQQVTPAHYRHGGEGAYYVYLRRPAG